MAPADYDDAFMSVFPEPTQWNGDDDRPMGNSCGPVLWKCLDCQAAGKGYVSRGQHWHATQHHIVDGCDPRANNAPRISADPKPETQCLTGDGQGRR
jgi:hypothetical protein